MPAELTFRLWLPITGTGATEPFCEECGEPLPHSWVDGVDVFISEDDELLCRECASCYECGEFPLGQHAYDRHDTDQGDVRLCADCAREAPVCEFCDRLILGDAYPYEGGGHVCESCYDHFATCYECGVVLVDPDHAHADEDGFLYCGDCAPARGERALPEDAARRRANATIWVGFEYEGTWDDGFLPPGHVGDYHRPTYPIQGMPWIGAEHDSSISASRGTCAELVAPPAALEDAIDWAKRLARYRLRGNRSMGFHIGISAQDTGYILFHESLTPILLRAQLIIYALGGKYAYYRYYRGSYAAPFKGSYLEDKRIYRDRYAAFNSRARYTEVRILPSPRGPLTAELYLRTIHALAEAARHAARGRLFIMPEPLDPDESGWTSAIRDARRIARLYGIAPESRILLDGLQRIHRGLLHTLWAEAEAGE